MPTETPTELSRLITTSAIETTYFGGTVWAADSNRYEAIPGGTWTFDSGVGSSIAGPGDPCKPAGYHRTFEGWTEMDLIPHSLDNVWRRHMTCAIGAGASMWLGLTSAEAGAQSYVAGAGYGHDWDSYLGKTFQYPGSGPVVLSFDYACEAEPDFDFFYVEVDTTGSAAVPSKLVRVQTFSGVASGQAVLTLNPRVSLPSRPGPVRILFHGRSDEAYDDQDGLFATTCGLATIDNVTLTGALSDAATFETGDDGWAPVIFPYCGEGEWADLVHLSALYPLPDCTINLGSCAMSDSVLLFHKPDYNIFYGPWHDYVYSPWIDLRRAGIASLAGCFIQYDGYFKLLNASNVLVVRLVQWVSGPPGSAPSAPISLAGYFPGQWQRCLTAGAPERTDMSAYVPADARAVRIGLGLIALQGAWDPDPGMAAWFDDVRFGVLNRAAPRLTLPQTSGTQALDAFTTDGTLNPVATARVDSQGDTLSCGAAGTNVEVRVNFQVRPGPFTNSAVLNAWAANHWTAAPGIGPGWWTARMDSAERNSGPVASTWMTALHESDSHFGAGTDRDRGADGDAGLSHDIFPDHLLTPGARIDYFYSARYLPPDPRNPLGDAWSVMPDTSGGHYYEMEVLPSSLSADTTWNCVLYVNGHAADNQAYRRLEEAGLHQVLGGGGLNAEGERFDRADLLFTPQSQLKATAAQLAAYRTMLWSVGENSSDQLAVRINAVDAPLITEWLSAGTPAQPRRFWYCGARTVYLLRLGTAAQRTLAQTYLGADCQQADWLNTTCSGLGLVAGAHFDVPGAAASRSPSCDYRSLDRVTVHASAAATARGQLKLSATGNFISVSNDVPAAGRRTLVDAFPLYSLRDSGGNCDNTAAVTRRVAAVLGWFGLPDGGSCTPGGVSDAGPPDTPPSFAHLELEPIARLAAGERWRFALALPAAAPLTLRLFDVTGREVRTLLDAAPLAAGRHEFDWDGRTTSGEPAASGLYFLRASAAGEFRTRKLVLTR